MDDLDPGSDEPLAKDLVRLRAVQPPDPAGWRTHLRLWSREARRPAGSSARTWLRVAGEDPFHLAEGVALMRRTTYVDGRLVRVDQEYRDAQRPTGAKPTPPSAWDKPGPDGFGSVPTQSRAGPGATRPSGEDLLPPGFRNLPTAARPSGEDLRPPGFRNLPVAAPRPANQGESLIPDSFRNLPVARPPDTTPKPPPKPEPRPVAPRPADPRPSGRVPVDQGRRRVPIGPTVVSNPPPAPAAAPTSPPSAVVHVAPPAPPAAPPAPSPSAPPAAAPAPGLVDGPADLFSAPLQGRTRMQRRASPDPARSPPAGTDPEKP